MYPRRIVACVMAGLLAGPLTAMARAERLPVQNFTVRDGLPADSINCMVRDPAGFIWICTAEGLAYYDGFVFRTFGIADGLPHRRVTRLLPARDGTYWIGTDGGLAWFRPTGRAPGEPRFTVLRPPAPTNWTPDTVIANSISALFEDRSGRIWCGTAQAGLFTVEGRGSDLKLRPVELDLPADTWINSLAEAEDGTLWIGTSQGLIRRPPSGDGGSAYTGGLVTVPELVIQDITSLLIRGSDVFVGTRFTGLHLLDAQARPGHAVVKRSWRTPNAQGGDRVYSLVATADGHLWYAGAGGAREVVPDLESPRALQTWGARAGLTASNVWAVAEDTAGNIWIGTDGAGVFRLRRGGFTTYTVDDGLAGDQVRDLFLAQGALHVVTADIRGLFLNRFDGLRFQPAPTPYTTDPFHNRMNQLAMYDRHREWWLTTPTGVTRSAARSLDAIGTAPGRRYGARDGLWSDAAYKVFEDSRGDVWIGTFLELHNLSRWRRDSGRIERHTVRTFPYEPGFGFGFVPEAFAEAPDGAVWVGSFYGGLARHMDDRWDYFDVEDGVPEGRIQTMLRDRHGRLWIGTSNGGLARVDQPGAPRPAFVHLRKSDGLSSNHVLALTEDVEGRIYVATGLGVDRLTPDTREVRTFGVEDGLPGGRVVTAFRDSQGDLWFGTNQGLARFRPSAFQDPGWPQLRVVRVSAPDLDVGLSDLGEREVRDLELQPHQNAVQIAVGALASGPRPGVRFEGRLEGTGSDWIPVEPGRPVMFLNLQPGAYRFVARAVTASGRSGPSSVSVAFTILRPWYQRPWAIVVEALIVLAVLAAAYNLRVRHLLALERVRSRIASDLHDDIGASLSRMAMLSEVARGHRGDDREAVAFGVLGEVAASARSLADQMADIVWSIDPRHDTVANVIGRASWFGSELFALRGTEWRCTVDGAAAPRRLGPDTKRHLLLLIKEALNNIAKHAGAREARLEVTLSGGDLALTIVDDGQGFDVAAMPRANAHANGDGHGLANMDARARAMGGTWEVSSSPGQGCRIRVRIPLAAYFSP